MRLLRFLGIWAVLLVVARGGPRAGSPERVVETDGQYQASAGFTFRVDVPSVSVAGSPDGSATISIEGFRARETRLGAPDLPAQTYRIAIPPGVVPRLEVRILAEDRVAGIIPRPVPRTVYDVPADEGERGAVTGGSERDRTGIVRHERFGRDETIYSGRDPWPASFVEIGEVGAFRDQRYVVVRLSPVRFDPVARGLRVARKVQITVAFDGDPGRRAAPTEDTRLEAIYRTMFVNYAEGTTFRLSALGASADGTGAAPDTSSVAERPGAVSLAASGETGSAAPASSGPVHKIKVRQNGVVRLDFTRMSGTGFTSQPLSSWKLTDVGVEVPLRVHDVNANDLLDAGDWVQFWGQAFDFDPKTVLNTDIAGTDQDIFEARDFTDENVYFLSVEAGPRARIGATDGAPTNVRTPPVDFEATAHAEVDNAFRPLGGADPWCWDPTLVSNATSQREDTVALPGLASTTAPLRVISRVRGRSENASLYPDHHTQVTLLNQSGQTLATDNDDGTFDGRIDYTHDFTWTYPSSGPTASGSVKVRLDALPISVGFHQAVLNSIDVVYRRSFQASGDVLVFEWPDGDAEFVVSGLASSVPEIWELTDRVATTGVVSPERVTGASVSGAGPYSVRFRMDNDPLIEDATLRRFVVFGSGAVTIPANPDFLADTASDLRSTAIQADLIVIAHPSVLGASSQTTLNQILSWRLANQGITSKIAWIGDIQDEFNDGLPGPVAIERFLQWVMSTNAGEGWAAPKPSFVLILGDASYDFKAGTAGGNFVPTQIMFKDDPSFGYYASDGIMAAVVGTDQMPDLAVGRVPARDDATCNTALQKILSYQQSPPTGSWRSHAVVVSDRGKNFNPNEAADFETSNSDSLTWMKRPPHTSRHLRYWSDYCGGISAGCTPAQTSQMRIDIKAAANGTDGISDGASIFQFIGHGNFDVWSDSGFFDNRDDASGGSPPPGRDTDDLANPGRVPLLFVHNCLSGGFMGTALHTLGEDWFFDADGGSVALFSPSGLSNGYFGETASRTIWESFFGRSKERVLGVPVMGVYADLCGIGAVQPCQNYVLLGDPATQAVFPTVGPATNVTATAGNAVVNLSWTASTTAGATYDVYRAPDNPAGLYAKVNATPIAGTAYADSGVVNAKTYYYYVVALDGSGFESRWSNFNSDCAISGPDCVEATPLNPNPPAQPTNVVVTDSESGGKLQVSWSANTETDLKSYAVHWGTQSGVYTDVSNVGKSTSTSISGLVNGQTYYIVVTATNTSDKTSAPSQEKTGVPTYVRGLRSPDFVSALTVTKSGTDAVLSWPAVTTDIYGKTTTISHYEIYRGTSPNFLPDAATKLVEVATTTFTDLGAVVTSSPNYHYLVRAVDTVGNVGGLGYQLPNGIDALHATKSLTTPGNVVLSWPAVSTDFDGRPTRIDHYEVYAQGTPFSRADIRDGVVPLLTSTAATSVDVAPPAETQYYSVIVVDTRGNESSF